MYFTTDRNSVLQVKDAKEYRKGVRREIMPLLEGMVKNATTIIKEKFDVDVFETVNIRTSPRSVSYDWEIGMGVRCGFNPKTPGL